MAENSFRIAEVIRTARHGRKCKDGRKAFAAEVQTKAACAEGTGDTKQPDGG